MHKARELSKEDFQQAVERELTGKLTEPWEIVYFKLYQSQMPVIEKAIETAALMLGGDRDGWLCESCGAPSNLEVNHSFAVTPVTIPS